MSHLPQFKQYTEKGGAQEDEDLKKLGSKYESLAKTPQKPKSSKKKKPKGHKNGIVQWGELDTKFDDDATGNHPQEKKIQEQGSSTSTTEKASPETALWDSAFGVKSESPTGRGPRGRGRGRPTEDEIFQQAQRSAHTPKKREQQGHIEASAFPVLASSNPQAEAPTNPASSSATASTPQSTTETSEPVTSQSTTPQSTSETASKEDVSITPTAAPAAKVEPAPTSPAEDPSVPKASSPAPASDPQPATAVATAATTTQ